MAWKFARDLVVYLRKKMLEVAHASQIDVRSQRSRGPKVRLAVEELEPKVLLSATTLPFNDTFDANPPTQELVSNWLERAGHFNVQTDQAIGQTKTSSNLAILDGVASTNVSAQAKISFTAVGQNAGLAARYSGAGDRNMYLGNITSLTGGKVQAAIFRNVAGIWTKLASKTIVSTGGLLRFEVVGPSLKLFLNDSLVTFANDTKITGAGSIGIRAKAGVVVDDFSASAITLPVIQALPFSDFFNANLSGNQLSADWLDRVGNFNVQSTQAIGQFTGVNLATVNGITTADVALQANIRFTAVGQYTGLLARYSGPGDRNMYLGNITSLTGGKVQAAIFRNVNGTWTQLANKTIISTGGLLRFEVVGPSLKLFLNNFLVVFANDTKITGAGSVGIRAKAGVVVDDFVTLRPVYVWYGPQDGRLLKYAAGPEGSYTVIGTRVSKFAETAEGHVYHLTTSGGLYADGGEGGSWDHVQDFAIDAHGTLYILNVSGLLQQQVPGGWTTLGSNVSRMALRNSATSLYYLDGAILYIDGIPSLADTKDFAIEANGTLSVLNVNGLLQQQVAGGWTTLGSNVNSIAMTANATLYVLQKLDWAWAGWVQIGDDWNQFTHIFMGTDGWIYAKRSDGELFKNLNRADGTWAGWVHIGSDWNQFTHIFMGTDGWIYAKRSDGELFKNLNRADGTWAGWVHIGSDWNQFTHIFMGTDGWIYAKRSDGELFKNLNRADGTWAGWVHIGSDWNQFTHIFMGNDGWIYAKRSDGALFKNQYRTDGTWEGWRQIGADWNQFTHIFMGTDGWFYAKRSDGVLLKNLSVVPDGSNSLHVRNADGSLSLVAESVNSFVVRADGALYVHQNSGLLRQQTATGWIDLGINVASFVVKNDGTLYILRKPDWAWAGWRQIGSGWNQFTHIFMGTDGWIYAKRSDGELFKNFNRADGTWAGWVHIGSDWNQFTHIFMGTDGWIYAKRSDGEFFKNLRRADGTWAGWVHIGSDWNQFTHIFMGTDGWIYAKRSDGELFKNLYRADGTWAGWVHIGSDWNQFSHIFMGTDGWIYAKRSDGELFKNLYRADGTWAGWVHIGSDWNQFTHIFMGTDGWIYAKRSDGALLKNLSVVPDGSNSLYVHNADGSLSLVAESVRSFVVKDDGAMYVLHNSGLLREQTASGWIDLGTNVDPSYISIIVTGTSHVSSSLNGNQLTITGSQNDDFIVVRQSKGRIFIEGVSGSFDGSLVKSIIVNAEGGNDFVSLKAAAFGNATTINGGNGNDYLYGGNGNDALYGELGNDALYGGDGNDMLFAGFQASAFGENMYGGGGADRFLLWFDPFLAFDTGIQDGNSADAYIKFVPGVIGDGVQLNWDDAQIRLVDQALGLLHSLTNNTSLLKLETGAGLTFVRKDITEDKDANVGGDNNDLGTINVYNAAFSSEFNVRATVLHEIGHNWDNEWAFKHGFLGLSGWVQNPSNTVGLTKGRYNIDPNTFQYNKENWWRKQDNLAAFKRDYGRLQPEEDWSTVWELYLQNSSTVTTVAPNGNAVLTQKLKAVHTFFATKKTTGTTRT